MYKAIYVKHVSLWGLPLVAQGEFSTFDLANVWLSDQMCGTRAQIDNVSMENQLTNTLPESRVISFVGFPDNALIEHGLIFEVKIN